MHGPPRSTSLLLFLAACSCCGVCGVEAFPVPPPVDLISGNDMDRVAAMVGVELPKHARPLKLKEVHWVDSFAELEVSVPTDSVPQLLATLEAELPMRPERRAYALRQGVRAPDAAPGGLGGWTSKDGSLRTEFLGVSGARTTLVLRWSHN